MSVQPVVTLGVKVSGTDAGTGATVSVKGTFRGRAVAGRRTYRLLPRGAVFATHRHGAAGAQRARVDEVFVHVRSDSDYLRVVGTGRITGGPPIQGPRGACQRITFRFIARPAAGAGSLRWACRRAGADRSPPIHLDVLSLPRDTIVSSYTLIRRPCSPTPAERRGATEGRQAAPCA